MTLIDSHDFGLINGTHRATLSGGFVPLWTGLYTLRIWNHLDGYSSASLYSYVDNISLKPKKTNFHVSPMNINAELGGELHFKLTAGAAWGGMRYWIWMSNSGTYPGYVVNGVTVPLNYDWLLEICLKYPGLPGYGDGLIGYLSNTGDAEAKIKVPPDIYHLMGTPVHFAYVLMPKISISNKPDVKFASFPVHAKYIPH